MYCRFPFDNRMWRYYNSPQPLYLNSALGGLLYLRIPQVRVCGGFWGNACVRQQRHSAALRSKQLEPRAQLHCSKALPDH